MAQSQQKNDSANTSSDCSQVAISKPEDHIGNYRLLDKDKLLTVPIVTTTAVAFTDTTNASSSSSSSISSQIAITDVNNDVGVKLPENKNRNLTGEGKRSVLQTRIEWPRCEYNEMSIRRRDRNIVNDASLRLDAIFNQIREFAQHQEIAIDGMSGVGKSTLCQKIGNRMPVKINELAHEITKGSSYNVDPLKCMQYMMTILGTRIRPNTDHGLIWDRCCYSNLVFYFVHHLQSAYADQDIPIKFADVVAVLNNFAHRINFEYIVAYTQHVHPVPTLFIVCSDPQLICQSLINRGRINDIYNAKEYNYQVAQIHAYTYIAKCLNYPLIDLYEIMSLSSMSLTQIQNILIKYLNYKGRSDQIDYDVSCLMMNVAAQSASNKEEENKDDNGGSSSSSSSNNVGTYCLTDDYRNMSVMFNNELQSMDNTLLYLASVK